VKIVTIFLNLNTQPEQPTWHTLATDNHNRGWLMTRKEKQMSETAIAGRWAKESLAMLMVGDALVTLVDPERHCRLWMKGPEGWRRFVSVFIEHPGITRGLAVVELGLGVWLAEKQKPVSANFH
jgi:hypothetical protein